MSAYHQLVRAVVIGLAATLACSFEAGPGVGQATDAGGDAPSGQDAGTDAPNARCVEPSSGLVAWWDGEQIGVDIAGDFDATGTAGNPDVTAGMVGGAATFDDGERLDLGNPPPVSSFTVEGWIRRTADDLDYQTIYGRECRNGFAGNPRAGLFLLDHKLTAWFADGGLCPGQTIAQSSATIAADRWTHVAATFDGDALQLFIDASADGSGSESAFAFHPGTARIGGADIGDGQNLVGQIDELSIYDRALAPAEITAIVEAGAAGKCK